MFKKVFNLPVFIISLFLGLVFIYLNRNNNLKTVYVYPIYNLDKIEYKDTIGNCFDFSAENIDCPSNKDLIKTIPVQSNK